MFAHGWCVHVVHLDVSIVVAAKVELGHLHVIGKLVSGHQLVRSLVSSHRSLLIACSALHASLAHSAALTRSSALLALRSLALALVRQLHTHVLLSRVF